MFEEERFENVELENVIGFDQELYNLLHVPPNCKEQNTSVVTNILLADVSVNTKLEKGEERGSQPVPVLFDVIPEMVEDTQTIEKVLEMDAVETLDKTLVNTNYVIQSNTVKETLQKEEQTTSFYEELTIPLIRNTDDQLNVFLAMDMQQSTGIEEPINGKDIIPIVRSLEDQLSVFLAADIQVNTEEDEHEVSNMERNVPILTNTDDDIHTFEGDNDSIKRIMQDGNADGIPETKPTPGAVKRKSRIKSEPRKSKVESKVKSENEKKKRNRKLRAGRMIQRVIPLIIILKMTKSLLLNQKSLQDQSQKENLHKTLNYGLEKVIPMMMIS